MRNKTIKSTLAFTMLSLFFVYVKTYIYFRQEYTEVVDHEGDKMVVFPNDKGNLFFFYLPLIAIDTSLTGEEICIPGDCS